MSYGIKIFGANGQTIHDSTETGVEFFAVSGSGSLTPSNTTVSYNKETELLFVRPSSGYTFVKGNTGFSSPGLTVRSTTNANDGNYVDYFKCKKTSQVSQGSDAYGLEVLSPPDTNNNQTVTFSSRRMSSAVDILKVWDPLTISGTQFSNNQATIYSGSTTNVYVAVSFMVDNNGSLWGTLTFNSNSIVYTSAVFLPPNFSSATALPNYGSVVIGKLTA